MKSFHHTWLLCVFQSIWIFFLPDQSASVWLPSWIQLRGHPGGSICWDVMWCDPFLFVSTSCCMYFSTSLPPIICLRGKRGEKASFLKFTGDRGGSGSGSLLFQSFWNVLHTQTHTDHLMPICNHSALQVNHKSLLSCCNSRMLLLFDELHCCGLIKQGEQLKDFSQNDFQIICAYVK